MAYNFAGTFTKSQFARFRQYVTAQLRLIDDRILHLQAEKDRVGNLAFAYDKGGIPFHVESDSIPDTYCGKLFVAYEALGGDAEFDLQVRSTSQPVFRIKGSVTKAAQLMSNGETISTVGRGDAESAVMMQKMRSWVHGDLHRRREYLERKIRRALDYAEQLTQEISQLQTMKQKVETPESLDYYLNHIDALTLDPRYTAITNDDGQEDPHGKFARAPLAAYTPNEGGAPALDYARTRDGLVKPTQ